MASQHCGGEEEKWEVASVCRFHRLKQSLSKRSLPHVLDKPIGRCNCRSSLNEFLDAFQGYHQIPLALDDQEKTVFITLIRNYHYKVMPFDLKNAGSTY